MIRRIHAIHERSKGTYGAPRIHAELADAGVHVGRKRVARLMRAEHLRGVSRRKAPRTTQRKPGARPAPDLVKRNFTASGPDHLWVTMFVNNTQECHPSFRPGQPVHIPGLRSALSGCRGATFDGLIGDCYDNALCESFFATLECELLDRNTFHTPTQARLAVFEFIEGWYNPHRRHSALDYLSPNRYEADQLRTPISPSRHVSTETG